MGGNLENGGKIWNKNWMKSKKMVGKFKLKCLKNLIKIGSKTCRNKRNGEKLKKITEFFLGKNWKLKQNGGKFVLKKYAKIQILLFKNFKNVNKNCKNILIKISPYQEKE